MPLAQSQFDEPPPERRAMVNIQVTGPTGSKKGYIMVAITKALRDLGCDVHLQGEYTHLAEKMVKSEDDMCDNLLAQEVNITELQTTS